MGEGLSLSIISSGWLKSKSRGRSRGTHSAAGTSGDPYGTRSRDSRRDSRARSRSSRSHTDRLGRAKARLVLVVKEPAIGVLNTGTQAESVPPAKTVEP